MYEAKLTFSALSPNGHAVFATKSQKDAEESAGRVRKVVPLPRQDEFILFLA